MAQGIQVVAQFVVDALGGGSPGAGQAVELGGSKGLGHLR